MKRILDILITAIIIVFLLKVLPVVTTYLYEGGVETWEMLPALAAKSKFLNYMGDVMYVLTWIIFIMSIIYIPLMVFLRIVEAKRDEASGNRSRSEKSYLNYIFTPLAGFLFSHIGFSLAQALGSHLVL